MKLEKINYNSAVVFGAVSLVMYLAIGLVQWAARNELMAYGIQVSAVQSFVVAPLVAGIAGYLITLLWIAVYNTVAKKYPISWVVKK